MRKVAEVQSRISEDYQVRSNVRDHVILSDEPAEVGGMDKGPKPTELLLTALGSCIGMTLRMYAQRKSWDIGEIVINLEMFEDNNGTTILKRISFMNEITEEQRKRLLDISNRCPVAKILSNPVQFSLL